MVSEIREAAPRGHWVVFWGKQSAVLQSYDCQKHSLRWSLIASLPHQYSQPDWSKVHQALVPHLRVLTSRLHNLNLVPDYVIREYLPHHDRWAVFQCQDIPALWRA